MKIDKIQKELGLELCQEIEASDLEGLKNRIVGAESSIKQAVDELEANEQYQALKESVKDMSAGLRDVKKRQKAIIEYSLMQMADKGSK